MLLTPADETRQSAGAWIFSGELPDALYQIGVAAGLLEAGLRPTAVYGEGIALLPALLCTEPDNLRERWELLRAERLLQTLALHESFSNVGIAEYGHAFLHQALTKTASATKPSPETRLLALADEGYVDAVMPRRETIATDLLIRASARGHTSTGEAIALGIDQATRRGSSLVIIPGGPPWLEDDQEVTLACDEARKHGAHIEFLACRYGRRPSIWELVLPGLGVVDKWQEHGRETARNWARRVF